MSRSEAAKLATHCQRGHEYTPENTRIFADGGRRCRECVRRWEREKSRGRFGWAGGRGARKPRDIAPLTPAQQLVVAEAVRFAERIVSRFERKYGHIIEFRGETHLKIVREVASFDPSRSSLATWARVEAQYACLDALRRDSAAHARHKGRGKGRKICSLNTMLGDGEAGLLNGRLEDPHDDIAGVDERDEIEWLLSLAPPNAREAIYRVDVMGESNVGLARSLGITDVALHSRRKAGLAKIRKAIEDRRRIRGTATQAEAG